MEDARLWRAQGLNAAPGSCSNFRAKYSAASDRHRYGEAPARGRPFSQGRIDETAGVRPSSESRRSDAPATKAMRTNALQSGSQPGRAQPIFCRRDTPETSARKAPAVRLPLQQKTTTRLIERRKRRPAASPPSFCNRRRPGARRSPSGYRTLEVLACLLSHELLRKRSQISLVLLALQIIRDALPGGATAPGGPGQILSKELRKRLPGRAPW